MPEELRAAIVLFASLLDERQRRLFAGLESLKCGWGGDRRIATLLGIDPSTVAAGRRQLVDRDVEVDRVRRAGGGRTPTEKKRREVLARIQALMTHETAGDPVSGLKWTHRTTAKLAHELRGLGIHVCPQTVARLLKAMGYSLRVNHKKLAGASHPNRDQQFRYITELRERCAADNPPGHQRRYEEEEARRRLPQSRREVGPQPRTRQRPRLPLRCRGLAIPYGIYDPRANAGTVLGARQESWGSCRRGIERALIGR